jgi:serine/threonine protein kinase
MSPASAADLVALLRQHELLEIPQLEEVTRALQPQFPQARALARELVWRGWLTAFQVNQIFQGRAADLVLGSYLLLERLGEGGMSQVFKARCRTPGRIVALKVLRKDMVGRPEVVRRFHREVRAAAQLAHPNIVQAYDAENVGDTAFLAMEYVPGVNLQRLVETQGPLPAARACDCIRQAALGLQHVHERGLVHRDVKPSNLMLTPEGQVKILDLGLARQDQPENAEPLTGAGMLLGSADYMAPEQADNAHTVDIRADLYSLGCIFYFLLAGRPPFAGGNPAQKLRKHRDSEPEPIEDLCPDLPPGLRAILRRLMAKRPEDRYQTPAELVQALEPFTVAAAGAAAPPPTALPVSDTPMTTTPSRHPWSKGLLLWLGAGVLLVIVLLVVILLLSSLGWFTHVR